MDIIPNLYPFKAAIINAQEQERLKQLETKGKKKAIQMEEEIIDHTPTIINDNTGKKFKDYIDLI